jgi:hypothetical protein
MKALKSTKQLSYWGLRISLIAYLPLRWFQSLVNLNIQDTSFYLSIASISASFFILLGAILSKEKLSLWGGLLLFLTYLFISIRAFTGSLTADICLNFSICFAGLMIFSSGNRL